MTEEEALQAALAGEHACVWGYGVVGARLDGREERAARAGLEAHRVRRDLLADRLRAAGAVPVAALAAYALPFPVGGAASARRLAGLLEQRQAVLLAALVAAAADRGLRRTAARSLASTAVRAASWTGGTPALPGLDVPAG